MRARSREISRAAVTAASERYYAARYVSDAPLWVFAERTEAAREVWRNPVPLRVGVTAGDASSFDGFLKIAGRAFESLGFDFDNIVVNIGLR